MAQLYDVILTGYPPTKKISVIKAIREITGMGLAEAKACSESLPTKVIDSHSFGEVHAIHRKLQEAGGEVSVFEAGTSIEALDQQRDLTFDSLFEITLEPGYHIQHKIYLIKLIREITGLGLAEAKHYSESLPRIIARDLGWHRVNIIKNQFEQAGATVTVRLSTGEVVSTFESPPDNNTTENYEVVLEAGYEAQYKIGLIKVVREQTGLGLAEAKAFVESLPRVVKSYISHPHAKEIREKLEDAHGRVTIREVGSREPASAPIPQQQQKQTLHRVTLQSVPSEWYYAAINVVREITGLSLVEAGDFVDSCPKVIYEGPDQSKAQQIKERLEKARLNVVMG